MKKQEKLKQRAERFFQIILQNKSFDKRTAISLSEICRHYQNNFGGGRIDGQKGREVIRYIRFNIAPSLIAGGKGYYFTSKKEEIEEYILSLRGRWEAIKELDEHLQKYLINEFYEINLAF